MLIFPVVVERDGRGYFAHFPDVPEAMTSAASREEVLDMARDALETAIEFYFEDRRQVPTPSKVAPGQDSIELPASLSAKVLLLNEMISQSISPSELARRLGTSPQSVQRIIDIDHATKIDTIEEAFQALGRRLDLRVKRFANA